MYLDRMSRAELLDLCKEQGWKATGWKKDKMLEELKKLHGIETEQPAAEPAAEPVAEQPIAGVGETLDAERVQELTGEPQDAPEELDEEEAAPKPVKASAPRSGWCLEHWPLWTVHHTRCRAHDAYGNLIDCSCECHAEGWKQPAMPKGATRSKFETGELSKPTAPTKPVAMPVVEKPADTPDPVEMPVVEAGEPVSLAGELAASIGEQLDGGADYVDAVETAAAGLVEQATDEEFAAADQESMVTGEPVEQVLEQQQAPVEVEVAPVSPEPVALVEPQPVLSPEQQAVFDQWVEYLRGTRAQGFHQTVEERQALYAGTAGFPQWLGIELELVIQAGQL